MNLFESVSVVADDFIRPKGDLYILSTRGSNILMFTIAQHISKKRDIKFEIYQPGKKNICVDFKGISVNFVKCVDFFDFKNKLKSIEFSGDVVHYNNIDLFNGSITHKHITATIHTNSFLEKESANIWLKKNKNLIDEIIVVNTEYVKQFKGVKLIKNGIDENIFKYNPIRRKNFSTINILFPNLNSPKKNRNFAIKFIKNLNTKYKKRIKFRLILTGKYEKLPLSQDEYVFEGEKLWGKDMNQLYRDCQFTIIPSISESCSLCSLESMSSGSVVLANDIPGIRDYFRDGIDGYLIDVKNIEKWEDRVISLVDDTDRYLRTRQNARDIILKEYNSERMSNEYYSMWLNLLEDKNE
jgi:glycosyltransferase involved in cell wall biosynthesis